MLFVEYATVDADPDSGTHHIHTDHLGCPERILDDAGQTVWKARIDPYGTAQIEVGADFHQPLRWPGHYYDAETGLHENRFRSYSPEFGRYLQSDPIGIEGGLNLYAYTDNPTKAVDLRGQNDGCPDGPNCPQRKKKESEGGDETEGTPPKGPVDTKKLDNGLTRTEMDAPPGSKLSNGKEMPPGTRRVQYTDENGNVVETHYIDPSNNNRTLRSEVPIDSPASRKKESSRPTPEGMLDDDHRGHNAPERHAMDQRAANVPENIAPQAASSNLGPKKRHENTLPEAQKKNPGSDITHVTEHNYPPEGTHPPGDPRNSRPVSSEHGVEVDGKRDPAYETGPIPNDSSAKDYVLLSER